MSYEKQKYPRKLGYHKNTKPITWIFVVIIPLFSIFIFIASCIYFKTKKLTNVKI